MGAHMKTTIEIAPAILERSKRLAREEHVTLRALVEEGLRHVISAREKRSSFTLRPIQFTGGGFREGFESPSWDRVREAIYSGRGA